MQCIYHATDILEANIVKGLLEQQKISSHVAGFYLQGGVGEIPASGNASIWVENEDIAQARSIIEAYEKSSLDQ